MSKAKASYVTVSITCPYCRVKFSTRRVLKSWAERLTSLDIRLDIEDEATDVFEHVLKDAAKHIEECGS